MGVHEGEGDAVLVVGEAAGDEPGYEAGQGEGDLSGFCVERGVPPVAGDGLGVGRALVFGGEVGCVGGCDGGVGEG